MEIFDPVLEFEGKCIAIIHRTNDNDDKLIIVPIGKNYSDNTKCIKRILRTIF